MKKVCGSFVSKFKSLRQAKAEAARCLQCNDAPCSRACPAGTDPAKFTRQVALDNPEGASETILFNNVLGGTCGAVCPVSKLCEGACTRAKIDGPVRIGALQEFLHRYGIQEGIREPSKLSRNGQTVAVVGSGPAGLSTAREMQRLGFDATIFEARPEAGGALRYYLSPVRMDHNLVKEEIDRVSDLGVKIACNHRISDIRALEKEFDHVVVSPGLQRGRKLPHIPGLSALEFLESSNSDKTLANNAVEGKRVVVVGGGSVAMDAAVTSKALGASSVTAVFVEPLDEMRADVDEIRLAQEHHVTMIPERVVENVNEDGVSLRIRHVNQEDEFDVLHADTVIMAIGQEPAVDAVANLLHHEHITYAGDAISGGATVVQAVAEGKQVAERLSMESTGRSFADLDKLRLKDEEALQIEFCGITFPNPFCLSSSPVSNTAEMCARAFDAGWGGVVYKTLNLETEQEILHPSPRLGAVHDLSESSRIGIGLQNVEQISDRTLADNLNDISWLKQKYPSNVLGVSVMGFSESGWKTLVRAAEDHGADWVELNFSCPQMRSEKGGHRVGQDVDLIERYTAAAKSACSLPVVVKMTPNLTDMVPEALAAQQGGADAVSAVNTFKSISHVNVDYSEIDGDRYKPQPNVEGFSSISGFSGQACRPMALRFIAEMAQDARLTIPISGMGGIYTWHDAVEFLSLGASNLQCTTAVMHHGVHIVEDLKDGLLRHLRRLGLDNVSDIIGAGLSSLQPPEKLDLSTEAVATIVPDLCIGCGACVRSCRDGAADAIQLIDGVARVDPQKCVGCSLCAHVCPVEGAVKISTRTRIERPCR